MFALAIDLSQLYARPTELQNAADAAALAGAKSLQASSGSAAAINAAVAAAAARANKYQYWHVTFNFPANAIQFAASATPVSWQSQASASGAPANLRFVRVDASLGEAAPRTVASNFAAASAAWLP